MNSKKIVVVQNRPTQFDVPLYALAHRNSDFDLTVFYTEVSTADDAAIDQEINIPPQWDHLLGLDYDHVFESTAFRLWRGIIALHPQHVVICGWYPRSQALLALLLRLSGIRIGVRSDNTLEHTNLSGFYGWLKRSVMFVWLGLFHAWHPVGTLARAYVQKLSAIQRPVYYFPYAIDVDWFTENAARHHVQRSELRSQLGLAADDYVVLGVMKWATREDPLTLVEALLGAAIKLPNIKLLLVGDGPLKPEVMQRFAESTGRLVAPGYAKYSELPMYYAIADIFVHPARSEPYGVSVQEAMACGLPVIVSDKVGAAAEFLELGSNGDIFPAGNVLDLTSLLITWAKKTPDGSIQDAALRKARDWSYALTLNEWKRCLDARR